MPLQLWPKSSKKSLPTNVQRKFSGYNGQDGFSVSDDEATDIKNMTTANYPVLSTRPGYSLSGTARAARILGVGVWKQTELAIVSNGAWYKNASGTYTSMKTGLSTSANWSFANFKGNFGSIYLIGANGTDAIQKYSGGAVSDLATAPTGGNYIEQFGDRVWCAAGNVLYGCTLGNASDWTTFNGDDADPYTKTLETPAGENIVGLKAGNTHLTIFYPNAIQELYGYVPSDFNSQPVTYNIGAVSNQAITSVEGTFYFIHTTGFYKYAGGTLPTKNFSKPIQNLINRINPSHKAKCCAGNNGKFVYLSIPLDSATDPDTIIEYNTEFGTFSVWKDFAALNMGTMAGTLYIGGTEGQIRVLGGSTSDNGSAISWYVISKPFTGVSLSQRLMWKTAWTTANVATGSTMSASLSKSSSGNSDFTSVATLAANNALEGTRIPVPTTTVAYANWIRYKLSGTGYVDVKEFARYEETLPIV